MAQKVFGPTRGAGTKIVELEGSKSIVPSALGWAGYVGVLERGPVGKLIYAQSRNSFDSQCGEIIDESMLPDICRDYYSIANGSGGLLLIRVTDGNELQAETTLYARKGDVLTPMGKLKAANGGRWGGKAKLITADMSAIGDLTETTLDTGSSSYTTDELKGGYIELSAVANSRYEIIGNTASGVISVNSDQTMLSDHGGGGDLRYYIVLENEGKALSFIVHDGEEDPDNDFGLSIYLDGNFVKKYSNLSLDPSSPKYWVNIINNDGSNFYVEAEDLWTGAYTADVRPANIYGKTVSVTATILTAAIDDFTISSVGGGDPTFALGTTDDAMIAQQIVITMTGATAGDAVSDKFGSLGAVTLGALFTPNNKWTPPFTVTAGGTALAAGDVLTINYKPFVPDSLIDGYLYPDKPNAKKTKFRITDNDHKTITVASGSDLTVDGAPNDYFMVEAALELSGGRDGIADLTDADYLQAWEPGTCLFNRVLEKGYGLLKLATPGVYSTAVQKAGVAYADANNYQYRYEIPSTYLTENEAVDYINDTIGRSNYAVVTFPSYGYSIDPNDTGEGKWKLTSLTGKIHGRESAIARDYEGYHKAEAGIDAVLNGVLDIPTGDAVLDQETLIPIGMNIVIKKQGNYILWGDRTLYTNSEWKWKHQREQMSYYELTLQINFDWLIFQLNDTETDTQALAALTSFFRPEYTRKRALRGKNFADAAIIRVDAELNTDQTREDGDKIAEILLKLAATTERFIIRIGKQGIFESVS